MRISDFFKKSDRPEKFPTLTPSKEEQTQEPAQPHPDQGDSLRQTERPAQIQVAEAIEQMRLETEKAKALYQETINLIKHILKQAGTLEPINFKDIFQVIDGVVSQMMLSDTQLLHLVDNPDPSEDYLCSHSFNVLVLSIELGLSLGYNKSRLDELSIGALLYHIKILKVSDPASQANPLTKQEYDSIKGHSFYSPELLQKIKGRSDFSIYVTGEKYEIADESEYSRPLENGYIKEYAKLISLVEAYENLTRPCGPGKRYTPHEATKELLSTGLNRFEPKMMKALINLIGIYPVGTWVELDGGEIAKVLELNKDLPLRPVVNIIFDNHRKRLKEPRMLNLAKHYNVYIKRLIMNEEFEKVVPFH